MRLPSELGGRDVARGSERAGDATGAEAGLTVSS